MEDTPIDTVAAVYSLQLSIADFVFLGLNLLIPDNNRLFLDITSKGGDGGGRVGNGGGKKKVCARGDLVDNRFVSHMRCTQGNRQVKQTRGRGRGRQGGERGGGSSNRTPLPNWKKSSSIVTVKKGFLII